ncbi:IAA-amino acid hydrolase ILR1-like [Cornus florida]|uniref:IAA-amino acid hydrolase ILR1-like n=1 Tax=Cornus florida TaxID=4283 RepID=UPI002898D121|nr:IAA-amino acid hydrolase ILR1-like [Cornus florida]
MDTVLHSYIYFFDNGVDLLEAKESNKFHPTQIVQVVTVGSIHGGQAGNVIPHTVEITGTYRSLTSQGLSYLQERIKEVIEMQAAVHQCSAVLEDKPMPHPVVVNDEALYEHGKRVGEILLGKKFPAAMFVVGTKNETLKSDEPLHSPYFVIDEDALSIGAAFHAVVAISFLDSHVFYI